MMTSWLVLMLLLGALRFLPDHPRGERPWRRRYEIGLAVALGLVFGLLACAWFSLFHLTGPTSTSDFYDFCGAVSSYRAEDLANYSRDRSFLAGWLPSRIAVRVGILDGLAWTAILSTCILGTGLYTWGRAVHSRWAGVYTLVFALALAPLVVLGRTLTFYPEYVATFSLSAGLVCLALRFRSRLNLLVAAASIGLCLLIDVRGVVWAVPSLFLLCLVYLPQGWKRGGIHGAILLATLSLSWWAGSRAYGPSHTSLDDQANPVRLYNEHKAFGEPLLAEPGPGDIPNFVWGQTPIQNIPKTLFLLARDTKKIGPLLSDAYRTRLGRQQHFDPWYPVVLPLLLLGLFGLRKERLMVLGLLVTSAPFLAVLYHASTLEFRTRFASSAMPPIAVFLGLGLAVLWGNPSEPPLDPKAKFPAFSITTAWPSALRILLLLGLVGGAVPNYLSPSASWRVPFQTDREVEEMRTGALGGKIPEAWGSEICVQGIREDWKSGLPPLGKIYY
jgi:hypothetical protein